jgi:hypothetical protein
MARANMLHATVCWPERLLIDCWPFAMSYAIWIHNRLPPHGYGLSPDEVWSGVKNRESELSRAQVWGCPVYVLDPALQDGKKIPKWDSRARQGIFVGFSEEHSSLVPLVFNLRTPHISPQYHVIFDDEFTTILSMNTVAERDAKFEKLFESAAECFVEIKDLKRIMHSWMMNGCLLRNLLQRTMYLPIIGCRLCQQWWLRLGRGL